MTDELPDGVRINQPEGLEEGDDLGYPNHRLLGLLPSEASAWALAKRLAGIGVSGEQVDVFIGEEGVKLLHSHHGQEGLRRLLVAATRILGDEDLQSQQYEEGVQAGNVLLAVRIPESMKDEVAELMKGEGGFGLRYYSPLLIEDIP